MPENSPVPAVTNNSTTPSPVTAPVTQTTPPTTSSPSTPSVMTEASEGTTPSVLNEDAPKAPEGAPEKYTDWKLPEGMEFAEGQKEAVETLFKDSNITQENG